MYPQLINQTTYGHTSYGGFKFSNSWFRGFQKRQRISLRKRTNQAQKEPEHYQPVIQSFHQFIRKVAEPKDYEKLEDVGRFKLANIANMDQTPMPFEIGTSATYNEVGARTVWVKSLGSGLDKRQATVQLTVHADGEPQTLPMVIFRGKGLRISSTERKLWDKRVVVKFQPKAWMDENISLRWAQTVWKQKTFEPRLLILDVHTAQKTPAFLHALSLRNTIPAFVPPGCTSLIQPLDVSLNKPFKHLVDAQYNQHFEANLDAWVLGKISASERRILMTKWIGAAWEVFCQEYKDTIQASFIKCGIALPIDGSQDTLINIRGLNHYSIPPWQSNPQLHSQDQPTISPLSDLASDSECYTTATSGDSDSDDTITDSSDSQDEEMEVLDASVRQVEVLDTGVGHREVPDARVGQRRSLRSRITLGEEIV